MKPNFQVGFLQIKLTDLPLSVISLILRKVILIQQTFSHGHLPEAGREIHIDRMMMMREGGPLAKNQPEASPRIIS